MSVSHPTTDESAQFPEQYVHFERLRQEFRNSKISRRGLHAVRRDGKHGDRLSDGRLSQRSQEVWPADYWHAEIKHNRAGRHVVNLC